MALLMHDVEPPLQTSGAHVPPRQNCSGRQSPAPMHCTQIPWVKSHSCPPAGHVVSDAHLSLQVLAMHLWVIGQSLVPMHSTQRPRPVSQTCPCGQSKEFMHLMNGLQAWSMQSLLSGQSVDVTQVTHLPELVSQMGFCGSALQSRLFLQ